ncbi:MAG: hypothetical protein ACRD3V_07160 [Vicinamibacteria bacterium]
MANRSRQTFLKRQKERARQEKQRLKAEKRAQRKVDRDSTDGAVGEDPDIAGIVPGPQPLAWDVVDVLTEDEKAALEDKA